MADWTDRTPGWIHGWYQLAFANDVHSELVAANLGTKRFMLVRQDGQIRAYDADCPHRGAHLARGGCLQGADIVCPFHGYKVGLGQSSSRSLKVREYPTLTMGGLVLVRLSGRGADTLPTILRELCRDHVLIEGFKMRVRAPMEFVIENGFDRAHFDAVHGIRAGRLDVSSGPGDTLQVRARFSIPSVGKFDAGENAYSKVDYLARVISPGLAIVTLGEPNPYTIITGATDRGDGTCNIYLTLALPRQYYGDEPGEERYRYLLEYSKRGLEQDRAVWENLRHDIRPQWLDDDEPVRRFYAFCAEHRGHEVSAE